VIVLIQIKTPARIHFGQLDLNGNLGRIYGGSGAAIEKPFTLIKLEKSNKIEVEGLEKENKKEIVEKFLTNLKKRKLIPKNHGVRIEIEKLIPEHNGLGSGTQFGLAVAEGINRIYNLNLTPKKLAEIVDRKHSRSAIGFGAFYQGGFIVDAGRPTSEKNNDNYLPPIVYRKKIPSSWRFLIITPFSQKEIMAGKKEIKTFNKIKKMSVQKCAENAHHLLLGMLPAIEENKINEFSSHLNIIEDNASNYFSNTQKGKYTSEYAQEIIDFMVNQGVLARGQSYWGPALYGLVENDYKALKIKEKLVDKFSNEIKKIYLTKAANKGAKINNSV
jgi:beta-RFAP synthase